MEYFNKVRKCESCQTKWFKEKNNICKFECGNHTRFFDGEKWPCCGDTNIKETANPCVKYDHYDKETKSDIITLESKKEFKEVVENLKDIFEKKNELIKAKDNKLYCARNYKGKLKLKKI